MRVPSHSKFDSYAQNFEDARVFYAFRREGTYVEVGANDPVQESATYGLYRRGWTGILVEPNPKFARDYQQIRSNDTVITAAAWSSNGLSVLTHPSDRSGWARVGSDIPNQTAVDRTRNVQIPIRTVRLSDELVRLSISSIDFMTIDVEGMALEVLAGLDLERFRPKVLCIEKEAYIDWSSEIGTTGLFEGWEQVLAANSFSFVLDDGINRWFVPNENKHTLVSRRLRLGVPYNKISRAYSSSATSRKYTRMAEIRKVGLSMLRKMNGLK